jgi:hypothetical protein
MEWIYETKSEIKARKIQKQIPIKKDLTYIDWWGWSSSCWTIRKWATMYQNIKPQRIKYQGIITTFSIS